MIMSTIQMNLVCDYDSVGQGPGTSSQLSPRPRGSWGDDKYLLHVDQAVVTVIISAISVCVMLQCGRCQQQAGLPYFLMAGEASGKQMLSEDEQQGRPGSGWAFSPESQQSKHQFWVAGVRAHLYLTLVSTVQSPRYIREQEYRRGCFAGTIRLKGPNQESSSTFIGSDPEWVMG